MGNFINKENRIINGKKIIKIQNLKNIDKYKNNILDINSKQQIIDNWYNKVCKNKIYDDMYISRHNYFNYEVKMYIEIIVSDNKLKKIKKCIDKKELEFEICKNLNNYCSKYYNKNDLVSIYSEYKNEKYFDINDIKEQYREFKYNKNILNDIIFKGNTMDGYILKNECIDYIYNLYKNSNEVKYLLYEENIPATEYSNNNNFYMAFYSAYNSHGSIILSPDDIWIQICMNFSRYISEFPEELRYLFVDHEDKKQLVVTLDELDFKIFTKEILKQIEENTKDNLTNKLSCDFTTSGEFENFISNIVIMNCMKHYFEYTVKILCGIKEVHFLGTLDDWNKLLNKTEKLLKYNLPNNKWKKYIDELIPILKKFIETYKGDSNKRFWNGIIYQEFEKGYGVGSKPAKLTGWLTKFFYGNNENYKDINDVPIFNTEVSVKIIYQNGKEENANIYAGFTGINEENLVYRPQMSVFIK